MSKAPHSYFPSQVVSDQEKATKEYGLKVARAIEHEWFSDNQGNMSDMQAYLAISCILTIKKATTH